jgi:membrane-bound lytic murein transglycosylase D
LRKHRLISLFIIVILVSSAIKLYLLTENKYNYYGIKYFHAHRIETGDSLFFAGELVPLSDEKVKEKIEKELYLLTYYRSSTRALLRKMDFWLPEFEEIIEQYHIPSDFKYLVVIESNLANVVSNKSAVGFWQFRKATAEENGLFVNEQIDQRYDEKSSTIAACRYLRKMYRKLGSWSNVAASYNMGINGFIRQQKRQRQQSYYNLKLNKETGRYVYKMIALKIIDDNRKSYRFRKYRHSRITPFQEIWIDSALTNIQFIANQRGISADSLKQLNPWLLSDSINKQTKSYRLLLPKMTNPKKEIIVEEVEDIKADSLEKDSLPIKQIDTLTRK